MPRSKPHPLVRTLLATFVVAMDLCDYQACSYSMLSRQIPAHASDLPEREVPKLPAYAATFAQAASGGSSAPTYFAEPDLIHRC